MRGAAASGDAASTLKCALLLRELEGAIDRSAGEDERRPLGRDGPQIREGLGGDDGGDTGIIGGRLQGDSRAERGADEDDRS